MSASTLEQFLESSPTRFLQLVEEREKEVRFLVALVRNMTKKDVMQLNGVTFVQSPTKRFPDKTPEVNLYGR